MKTRQDRRSRRYRSATGSLEEDADVVIFNNRPEQYNRQDQSLRGAAEFIIGKQRNGPTGKLRCDSNMNTSGSWRVVET
jgi:replicative DNA helicase